MKQVKTKEGKGMKKVLVAAAVLVSVVSLAWLAGAQGMWGPRWGGGMMGPGMMGGWGGYQGSGKPLTLDQATDAAQRYLKWVGNPDLTLTEVMEFSDNFYAEAAEKSTGVHAFEVLIDRYTGSVHPEPGPNMMWNTKYGHMGGRGMMGFGMMGGWGLVGQRRYDASMSVTPEGAKDYAQKFLNVNFPGTTVGQEVDTFYGYYTIHVEKEGKVYGMLSVNGYTGGVWYHNWHGSFMDMKEITEH